MEKDSGTEFISSDSNFKARDIFKKRIELKPYEYPELLQFRDAIRHSYWLHTEFTLSSDVQDWFTKTSEVERSILKRTMLAISQIEVAVKTFWARIYDVMPKPEIAEVGMTFAESEVRHANAYSFLLDLLKLERDFTALFEHPVIKNRIMYLTDVQKGIGKEPKQFLLTLLLFSAFVEHISLFSQFLIMMSFNRYKSMFKGISNIVEATSKEEQIHGAFGQAIVNLVRKERPEWFNAEFENDVYGSVYRAYEAELGVVDWIFERGELEFLPKSHVNEFLKNRFNLSLKGIGYKSVFECDEGVLKRLSWFEDELLIKKENDFFNKRSVDYSKKIQNFTEEALF